MMRFWQSKIKAFLHDPPDKALILFHKSHKIRRDDILHELGLEYDKHLDTADHIASAMQRLDIPEEYRLDDARSCNRHICFKGVYRPIFKHTLSGESENLKEIADFMATYGYERGLGEYGFAPESVKEYIDDAYWKKTFLKLWRFIPEKYYVGYFLPADTRIPDHSIWDHLDVTTAISSCLGDLGLLAIKMPAVQEFISHSRKLSDLWASSHLYSTIIFEGIRVVIEKTGPDALIYPHLRENPLVDFYLSNNYFQTLKVNNQLTVANLPNTFLCLVLFSKAKDIARDCENAIKERWKEFSHKAKGLLKESSIMFAEDLWDKQMSNAISVSKAWLEFLNFDSYNKIKGDLPKDLAETQNKCLNFVENAEKRSNYGHFYFPTYELLARILTQNSRLWTAWKEEPATGKKCLMCGIRNAIMEKIRRSDGELEYHSWVNGNWEKQIDRSAILKDILKEGERLCAVCLMKRFYYREIFKKIYGVRPPKFESVVQMAGEEFIEKVESDEEIGMLIRADVELIYKHEWESEEKKPLIEIFKKVKEEKLEKLWKTYGEPNKYYAILMMDGDRIGKMLSGETLPFSGEFLHPLFKNEMMKWEKEKELVNTKRTLNPNVHIAISRAMKDFSVHKLPQIMEKYNGFLVYSGGDDILALFTTNNVLSAARELQDFFKKDFYEIEVGAKRRKVMGLGKHASMSAGIVFAHYKYPLYDVVEKVRAAEKSAKNEYGRNAFCMIFIKHSGEMLRAGGKWDCIDDLNSVAEAIINNKVSHRFIYDLMEAFRVLKGDMLKAEIKRLLKRRKTEKATDEEVKEICGKITCLISKYEMNGLAIEDVGKALKILHDAYRGEVE